MPISRPVLIPIVLLLSMVLLGTPRAFAAAPVTTTHQIVREEGVSWTLTTACESIQVPISSDDGERHQVIITTQYADGSSRIIVNDLVTGTATDSTGSYRFTYRNHSIEDVPAGGGAHQVRMTDTFVLNGTGSANHLNVGFTWRWTYTPPAAMWPPVDNVQKIRTRGEPLTCDPI